MPLPVKYLTIGVSLVGVFTIRAHPHHHEWMQINQNLRKGFGQRIRELRKAKGFSQEAFADKCGFMRTYMSRIETGTANPSLDAAKVLADGLGMSLSELLQGL